MTIEPLSDANYGTWSARMKALLILKGYWTVVSGEEEDDDSNALALCEIHLRVTDPILPMLSRCTGGKDAWDQLELTYQSKLKARAMALRRELVHIKKTPSEALSAYTNRALRLWTELTTTGVEFTEEELTEVVLAGLPTEYQTVVDVLQAMETTMTLDSILPKLLVVESRLKQHDTPETKALFTHTGVYRGGQGSSRPGAGMGSRGQHSRTFTGSASASSSHSSSNTAGARSSADKTCFYCGKKGHIKAECRKRQHDLQLKRAQPNTEVHVALVASHSLSSVSTSSLPNSNPFYTPDSSVWVIDSGATKHMSPDRSLFSSLAPLPQAVHVTFGNNTTGTALSAGDVVLHTEVGGRSVVLILRDVLYVPTALRNLFSVRSAVKAGAEFHFAQHSCIVSVAGKAVAAADCCDGLFCIRTGPAAPAPAEGEAALLASGGEAPELWHRRFGHLGYSSLARMQQHGMVTGMSVPAAAFQAAKPAVCEPCAKGKQPRMPFPASDSDSKAQQPLDLLHMDVAGPFPTQSLGGARYNATVLDDCTGYSICVPIACKSDVPDVVIQVVKQLERRTGRRVKTVRTDNGGEYVNSQLKEFFAAAGITHQTTVPYTPEQNGAAERLNRTLIERTRSMLIDSGLPPSLWAEAISTANYLRNLSPSLNRTETPYQLMWGKVPSVKHLRVFGARAFVHVPKELRSKLDPVSVAGRMVGYSQTSKGYRILLDGSNKVVVGRSIVFDEAIRASAPAATGPASGQRPVMLVDLPDGMRAQQLGGAAPAAFQLGGGNEPGDGAAGQAAEPEGSDLGGDGSGAPSSPSEQMSGGGAEQDSSDSGPPSPVQVLHQQQLQQHEPALAPHARNAPGEWWKVRVNPLAQVAHVSDTEGEPSSYQEAMRAPEAEKWRFAMEEEMASLRANGTWDLVSLPPGVKPIPCKWVYKLKRDADGNVERYKARLVVKGFMQREGIDYNEVFAPVSKHTSLRTLLSIVAEQNLEVEHLDVKTAFLNGELEEDIYMTQPQGYEEGGPGLVCHLRKTLYGLRQAPRAWHARLKQELEAAGYQASEADPGLFVLHNKTHTVYVLVYVDDILIAGPARANLTPIKTSLQQAFDVRDLGDVGWFLGMKIERDRTAGTLKISQSSMTQDLVTKFSLNEAKPKTTPLSASLKLSKSDGELLQGQDKHNYSELVGSLLYLSVCTRPDIAQAVGALSRFMACPTTVHWQAAKGVLRYLAGTTDMGITFTSAASGELQGYCDADYAGDIDTRRSTTGYVFVLNGGAISWSSRLQHTVAVSTAEAEYMAAAHAVKEALWLRKLLADLGKADGRAVQLWCNNQAALKLLKHPISSNRSKHIDVIYHFARERVARNEVVFSYCPTDRMIADCLTKAVPEQQFSVCLVGMGMLK